MIDFKLYVAALFLPLFPLSMIFNLLFSKLHHPILRLMLLFAWPQIGLWLALLVGNPPPDWLLSLALFTALLYGFRALVLRELGLWISFLACSSWAILWLVLDYNQNPVLLALCALGFSLPLALLALLGGQLEQRFGAAYTGLYNGLGLSMPRFSGVLVVTILAAVATPLFPGFAAMIAAFLAMSQWSFMAALVLALIWLLWGWAAIRLIQGFVIGESPTEALLDISSTSAWSYVLSLIVLAGAGIYLMGSLL